MKYDLKRFIIAQDMDYEKALQEIKNGQKETHWMWYIFPQISGLGLSYMTKIYELENLDEAIFYFENDLLRNRLIEISTALLEHKDKNIEEFMEFPDHLKLCSCMTLFEIVVTKLNQLEKYDIFTKVLECFYNGKRDINTINLLKNMEE